MRCTFKTVFYVNGSKEKNGIVPIMGRVTINGTIAQFSCKQSVTKAIWDAKGNRAIGKSKEAKEVNFALDNIKAQIAKHYQRLSDREAFVTAEMVRNAYQGIGTEYETLLRAFDKENAAFAKRVGKDRAKNTYNKYLVVRKYNGIRFYSCQNIVSTKTQQGMFRVTRNLLDYSQKNLPVGDLFLRSRTIKMERTYKKAQKVSDFSHRHFRFYIFVQN